MGLKNFKQLSSKVSDRKKFIALDECFFILVFVVVVVVCPFQKSLQRISSTFLRPLLRPLLRLRRAVDNYKDGFSMWSILLNYYCFLILRLYALQTRAGHLVVSNLFIHESSNQIRKRKESPLKESRCATDK